MNTFFLAVARAPRHEGRYPCERFTSTIENSGSLVPIHPRFKPSKHIFGRNWNLLCDGVRCSTTFQSTSRRKWRKQRGAAP
eukprot:3938123-Rhodomonas_salina.1